MITCETMDVTRFLAKAEQALRKRNPAQAAALYRQVLVASPGLGDARAGLLAAYRRRLELKGGASLLDRAAAKSLRAAAAGLAGAKKWTAQVKTCDAGLEKDPADAYLASCLADALEALERPEEALAVWRHRLQLDEGDVDALKAAGSLHYRLRQMDEALRCLEQAHALAPQDGEVQRLRKTLAAEGSLAATRYETARSSRELAVPQQQPAPPLGERVAEAPEDSQAAGDAEDFDLCWALTHTDLDTQELAAAEARVEEFSRRVAENPAETALRLSLARAWLRAGQTDRSIEQFQAVVKDPRLELEARAGLGACFARKGLLPLARRQLETALLSAGGAGGGDRGKEICYSLGLVCEREGDSSGALNRFMEVYEVDIQHRDVAAKIAELTT